jgi:hypothetical protein
MFNIFMSLIFVSCSTADVVSTKSEAPQIHIERVVVKSPREVVYETALDNTRLIAPHIALKTFKSKFTEGHDKQEYVAIDASNNASMFDRGAEDARIYKKFTDSCENLLSERDAEFEEISAIGKVKRPVATYLACSDGWISSCGCGGGRGCCSWHGGVGQCVTKYKDGWEYSQDRIDKLKSFYERDNNFIVCKNFVPPWPKYDLGFNRGRFVIVFQWHTLEHARGFEDPAVWYSDEPSFERNARNNTKAKLLKHAKLGVEAEYINGWKSFVYNK